MAKSTAKTKQQNWYQRWKKFPYHGQVHWLGVVFMAWVVGLVFLGNYSNDIQDTNTQSAQVFGVRAKRNIVPFAVEPTNTNTGIVMGETTGPPTSPSVLEQQGIEANRNSINSKQEPNMEEGEVLGTTTEEVLSPSQLEKLGIERAKTINK
ncbi:hypothetical protein KKG41_04520 [Patescibacteria group bacterium]|nr:hypothetical protein [Patescibacteria group bacterium]MBU1889943.1 hypothetical protein [Patescibacteria group bacterium]